MSAGVLDFMTIHRQFRGNRDRLLFSSLHYCACRSNWRWGRGRWHRWRKRGWVASQHHPTSWLPATGRAPLGACSSDRTHRRVVKIPSGHWLPGNRWKKNCLRWISRGWSVRMKSLGSDQITIFSSGKLKHKTRDCIKEKISTTKLN